MDYPIILMPLTEEWGGGWLAKIPNLPGCMADGSTPEEALRELADAKSAWLKAQELSGKEIPSASVLDPLKATFTQVTIRKRQPYYQISEDNE